MQTVDHRIDIALAQYAATALWSSTDESNDQGGDPLDDNYDVADIAVEALESMRADVAAFFALMPAEAADLGPEDIGHDFWLTRNGHGAGFWDGDYPEPLGDQLTDLAKTFGESYLIVTDDGLVYVA
jgi:hypothetical protein